MLHTRVDSFHFHSADWEGFFNFLFPCHNSGRTPKGSVQGAISTALTLAHQLKRIEPIEKEKLLNITYYRVAPEILEDVSTSEPRAQSNGTKPRKCGTPKNNKFLA